MSSADCNFLNRPDEFLSGQARAWRGANDRAVKRNGAVVRLAAPGAIPRRNFIDEEIFGRMEELKVASAPLSTDEEFLRRVTLDLTGRIPSPDDVRNFLANNDEDKRAKLIDSLLESKAFIDKWTWWMADLLQINSVATNLNRNINGRNAFFNWVSVKMNERVSLKDIAYQCVVANGNTYLMEDGASNFVWYSTTPGGPIQDTYDTMLSKTAATFLGIGYYDCVLCHNGRGHLDQLSLWGRSATRLDAQRMAAFFSRQQFLNHPEANDRGSFFSGARMVSDRANGQYDLNTTNGNRPPRCSPGATVVNNRCTAVMGIEPEYHVSGSKPASGRQWREAFADNMVTDPMFARNFANRLWKEMFNLGLVEPVDGLDPMRLDPNNPPPDGWTLQATHPKLLERLAADLAQQNFDLRSLLRRIANSNAYQLSSRYDGRWSIDSVPLFARHYPRRLEAEEIHDAIVKATGTPWIYTIQNMPNPAEWAMQLPEPREPLSNSTTVNFMNPFLRGNRDTQQRSQASSILQQLNLMNDAFVLTRLKVGASPNLRAMADNANSDAVVDEAFLLFLGRRPSALERGEALRMLSRANNQAARNTVVEDLAWVLVNKVEFIFSY